MTFLAPAALALIGAIAVPLVLHLLRRKQGEPVEFPALRYLLRAQREFSRTLKLRNMLLMLVRIAAVLALALDRKSTRLNSSHSQQSRMPSSA